MSEKSISEINEIIENEPTSDNYAMRGQYHYNTENFDDAIEDFSKAIEMNPEDPEFYYNRFLCYVELEKFDHAMEDINKAVELEEDHKYFHFRGWLHSHLGNHQKAIDDYSKAIQIQPLMVRSYLNLSDLFIKLNQPNDALSIYDHGINVMNDTIEAVKDKEGFSRDFFDQNLIPLYFNRGKLYQRIQEYDKALEDLKNVIDMDPNQWTAHMEIGMTLMMKGKLEDARVKFSELIKKGPEERKFLYYYQRGNSKYYAQNFQGAVDDFSKTIELNPEDQQAHLNRGNAYKGLEKFDKAIEDYKRALEINPDYLNAYSNLGVVYIQTNQTDKAMENFMTYVNKGGDSPDIFFNIANLHMRYGNLDDAYEFIQKSIDKNENFPNYWYLKAKIQYRRNNINDAKKALQKSLELNPNFEAHAKDDPELKEIL